MKLTANFGKGICDVPIIDRYCNCHRLRVWIYRRGDAGVAGSFALSLAFKIWLPGMPFIDRVGIVFLSCLVIGVGLSYLQRPSSAEQIVDLGGVSFKTGQGFNIGAAVVAAILILLYATYW